jgi:predicted lipase
MKNKCSHLIEAVKTAQTLIHKTARANHQWPEFEGVDSSEDRDMETAREKIDFNYKIRLIKFNLHRAIDSKRETIPEQNTDFPQFSDFGINLADAVMGVMDLAEAYGIPLGDIIMAKIGFSRKKHEEQTRLDFWDACRIISKNSNKLKIKNIYHNHWNDFIYRCFPEKSYLRTLETNPPSPNTPTGIKWWPTSKEANKKIWEVEEV